MKQVRVNELTVIAQSLGAKHVDIKLRTTKKKAVSISVKAKTAVKVKKVGVENGASSKQSEQFEEALEIWASTDFKKSIWSGNPVLPPVLYFKNESDIQSLIQMVMVNKSKITRRTYSLKASSSSGISLSEAANISASLKCIKVENSAAFEKNAKTESEAILEYSIEF